MNCSLKCDRHEYAPKSFEILQIIRRWRRPSPCNQHSVVIFVNDVANFDFWVPNLLNLKEFQEFQNILGIQLLQVPLCLWQISPDDSEISDPCLLLQVSLCL